MVRWNFHFLCLQYWVFEFLVELLVINGWHVSRATALIGVFIKSSRLGCNDVWLSVTWWGWLFKKVFRFFTFVFRSTTLVFKILFLFEILLIWAPKVICSRRVLKPHSSPLWNLWRLLIWIDSQIGGVVIPIGVVLIHIFVVTLVCPWLVHVVILKVRY